MAAPPRVTSAERRAQQQAVWDTYNAQVAAQQAEWQAAAAGQASPSSDSSGGGGPAPMSREMQSWQYVIQETDVIEECFAHLDCRVGLIYVCSAVSNGVLTDPVADVYIGRTRQHLTEIRGDATIPVLLNDSSTGDPQSCRTYVRGTAGTIVVLKYR